MVFGVSLDKNIDKWLQAIEEENLHWINVSDLKGFQNEAALLYGVTGIPANYLIDKRGKIIAKDLRQEKLDLKLKELLQKN